MIYSYSPLEALAAFAIVFAAGALAAIGMAQYTKQGRGPMPNCPRRH